MFRNTIQRFLKYIDIYGQKVELNFQNAPVFKTVYGGIITFTIGVLFLLGCWFYGSELVYKQNPAVISSQRSIVQAKRIDLLKENIVAMVGVSDGASKIWTDPTIFKVRAVQEILRIKNDTATGKIVRQLERYNKTMKICDSNDVGIPALERYFEKLDLSVLYCFDSGQELFMEGDFDAEKFAQVFVYVEKCKNSTTSSVICKSEEEIQQKLKLTKIQIFMSDNIIDPLNYETPFSSKGMNLYSSTSSSFPKELQIFFTNQYIQDDIGFMYQQVVQKHNFIFTDMKETTFFSDQNVLARILFRIQKQKENLMQRRYQKFADIVAQVGGLLKILTTIGTLVSYPFTYLYLFKAVSDKLFNFNTQDGKQHHQNQSQLPHESIRKQLERKRDDRNQNFNSEQLTIDKTIEVEKRQETCYNQSNSFTDNNFKKQAQFLSKSQLSSMTPLAQKYKSESKYQLGSQKKDIPKQNTLSKEKIKQIIEKSSDYFSILSNKIQYTFKDYFKQIFCYKWINLDQKSQLVRKGIQQTQNQLDVVYIIHKLQEIDKLKTIILSDNQLKLFDYIPKPVISEDPPLPNNNQLRLSQLPSNFKNEADNQSPILHMIQNSKEVYSNFKEQKDEQEKAQDAYIGLQNILAKQQFSSIDYKLIELLEPIILYKQQTLNQERPEFNNNCDDTIFCSNQFALQNINLKRIQSSYDEDQRKSQNMNFFCENLQRQTSTSPQLQKSQINKVKEIELMKSQNENVQNLNQKVGLSNEEQMGQSHCSQFEDEFNSDFQKMQESEFKNDISIQYHPTELFQINTIKKLNSHQKAPQSSLKFNSKQPFNYLILFQLFKIKKFKYSI